MGFLRALNGSDPGRIYRLDRETAVMGRHPDCDIILDQGAVSRQHARISAASEEFFVEDLGSRNGTVVNGQVISGRRRLYNNDQVKICDLLFSFHDGDPTATAIVKEDEGPVTMFDEVGANTTSTIMSTLEVKSSRSGLRMSAVNPEAKLKALLEISRNLGSAIALEQVLPKILDSLFKIFLQADRGFIVLQGPDPGVLVPKAMKLRRGESEDTIRISRTIVRKAMDGEEAILSADAATDSRFDSSQSIADFRIRSMMCAPLLGSEGTAMGVIQIDTLDQRTPFSQDDLDLLASVASQASFAVENAQLHEAALRQRALERKLELAHTVQQGFLPHKSPDIAGYEFDFYEPANQVGGDYFDYIVLPRNRLAIIVADVSGKGMPAALLMVKLSAEAKYALVTEAGPAGALLKLNAQFAQASWADRFVTMAIVVLDLERHEVQIANAGHLPPYLRAREGGVEAVGVDQISVPLGVIDELYCDQLILPLSPGDMVVMFTDGISEAMNMNNDLYGLARINEQVGGMAGSVRQLGDQILQDVKRFVGKRSQSDDMCLLCFGRKA